MDPFAGSGAVASRLSPLGSRFAGIEAHPLVAELAQLKLTVPPGDPAELRELAAELVRDVQPRAVTGEHDLVRRCFDPVSLGLLVAVRERLDAEANAPWRDHLLWGLLGTLREAANVQVGWPHQRPGRARTPTVRHPLRRLLHRAYTISDDLEAQPPDGQSRVVCGDARDIKAWGRLRKSFRADACISSPPYLNNFDYADATRLELFFLGRAGTWSEMCRTVRDPMIIATTQQAKARQAERDLDWLEDYPESHKTVTQLVAKLRRERMRRPRGKEYDRVIPSYFRGMAEVLRNTWASLRPGALAVLVVGDSAPYGQFVDTPRLLGSLAEENGFALLGEEMLRVRGRRWRTNGTRHQVALSERLLLFSRT